MKRVLFQRVRFCLSRFCAVDFSFLEKRRVDPDTYHYPYAIFEEGASFSNYTPQCATMGNSGLTVPTVKEPIELSDSENDSDPDIEILDSFAFSSKKIEKNELERNEIEDVRVEELPPLPVAGPLVLSQERASFVECEEREMKDDVGNNIGGNNLANSIEMQFLQDLQMLDSPEKRIMTMMTWKTLNLVKKTGDRLFE